MGTFCHLARPYQALELLAFGRALQKARVHHLAHLNLASRILLLGDGDGRLLAELVKRLPAAQFVSLDQSPRMIASARARIPVREHDRILWLCRDARQGPPDLGTFSAIVSAFFLDCFTSSEVQSILGAFLPLLERQGLWLQVDFSLPPSGWPRWRARCWLRFLYLFFRRTAGISGQALPPTDSLLRAHGLIPLATQAWQAGLLRSTVYGQPSQASSPRFAPTI